MVPHILLEKREENVWGTRLILTRWGSSPPKRCLDGAPGVFRGQKCGLAVEFFGDQFVDQAGVGLAFR